MRGRVEARLAKESGSAARKWWQRLLTVPVLVATAALTAGVSWAATELLKGARSEISPPAEPIALSVETNPAGTGAFADSPVTLVLPRRARIRGDPGPGCDGFRPWARAHGGVDAGATKLVLVVQGNVDEAVMISRIRATVLSRLSPLRGNGVECPPAGAAQFRALGLDLDREPPRVTYRSGGGAPFGFTLANGETETFNVVATATRARYRWIMDMDFVVDGRKQSLRIDDDGRAFETTPSPRGPWWSWNYHDEWSGGSGKATRRVPAGSPFPLL